MDLYASGSFQGVLVCLGWGIAAFWLSFLLNTLPLDHVGFTPLVMLVAPGIEEVLKLLVLIYYVRRAYFTYFVDGAIYGFAAGTAFAVLENLLYLSRAGSQVGLMEALSRTFSTALMHGSASAFAGVSLGRLRFGHGLSRFASLLLGCAAAMILHITFNNIVNLEAGAFTLGLGVATGLFGVVLTVAFIFWGLRRERCWLGDTLGLQAGVSAGELAVIQKRELT